MDKLKRVLSGNDETSNDENRGIMGDVGAIIIIEKKDHFSTYLCEIINIQRKKATSINKWDAQKFASTEQID